jgi:IS5 family transposase
MDQMPLGVQDWSIKRKVTRRAKFLSEMDAVMPWTMLLTIIEPFYPKGTGGRAPMPLERMLRIYFMQQWFNLSDPGMEDALYEIDSMRRFARLELNQAAVPDETTILNFRHLLEKHKLTEKMFYHVGRLLEKKGLLLKSGTIVDATIIEAPPSTKNEDKARDPEMHQTRKGKDWHFGMKLHVGTTKQGLVHSVATGPANEADISRIDDLVHGQEKELFGDQAYWSEEHRQHVEQAGIRYRVNRRGSASRPLSERQRAINRRRSAIRARGEHAFRVVKQLWGFTKTRYRGLAKNTARAFMMFALANLYMVRKRLLPRGAQCL